MGSKQYRSSNMIIQNILEAILRADNKEGGIIKSHLIKLCSLKTSTAEKYLVKMESANYIKSHIEPWGERTRIIYNIQSLGRERYEWFIKINSELE